MNAIVAQFERLAGEWRAEVAANPRLALLLMMVPGIVVLYLALVVRDAVDAAVTDSAPLERRAARLDSLAGSGDWGARIAAEQAAAARWEQELWRAGSAELAAADLQTVLQKLTTEHLSWSRLKLAPTEDIDELGGWRVRVEVNGKLKDEVGVLPLMQALAEHRPRILIDQFNLSSQRGRVLTLHLSVLVTKEGGSP